MRRSPMMRTGAVLVAMAASIFLMVVSNRPQQGVAGPGGAVDPVPEKPIPMPPGLIGLEIALGQDGLWAQAWQGEVRMSEGRALSLEVLQRSLRARVDGPYEHFGAPRSPTPETQLGGYQPAGFIWNALEKGYRLGFQSSSDHTSTHWSYAVVLAEDTSRQAIIDAFRKRHCYAAADNILVDVRSGEHLMGDLFTTSSRPTLEIQVFGTTPIARLHVIRNNRYVFSTEPKAREVSLRYTDDDQELKPGQTYYYYVRIE
jgi:hypothetical protein